MYIYIYIYTLLYDIWNYIEIYRNRQQDIETYRKLDINIEIQRTITKDIAIKISQHMENNRNLSESIDNLETY